MANPERSSFNCPSCGASVRITPGRNSMYCSFCGQPIIDVRKIVEQQAALEVRKEEMAAIRGHKAEMLEMDLSHERKKAGSEIDSFWSILFFDCFWSKNSSRFTRLKGILLAD